MRIKHTPGPWRVGVLDDNAFVLDDSTDPQPIAAVIRNAADAKLLAAAPALADALEALLNNDAIACVCPRTDLETGGRGHMADCDTALARAALRAAGRLT